MIRRLRWKFVLVFMATAAVLLGVLLTWLYLSSSAYYRRASLENLHAALLDGPRARAPMPLAVIEVGPAGETAVLLDHLSFQGDVWLPEALEDALSKESPVGELPARHLRYLRQEIGPGRMRCAFVDTYGEMVSLRAQAIRYAAAGGGALAVLLAIGVALSRWMVRPVAEAWEKQRQFLADASHELKTPLTAALANVDMALSTAGLPGQGKNRRRMEIAKTELLRMKGLVEDMLALARADAGKGRAPAQPFAPVDMAYLLTCTQASFEPVFFEAGRQLQGKAAPGCFTAGDPAKLEELLRILLDNACKYSRPGTAVTGTLGREGGRWLHLTVENDGTPIPEGALPHLFDRFFRADPSRGEIPGYGLGLAIAQEITAQHKGKIWAISQGGHTAFHVLLPAKPQGSGK